MRKLTLIISLSALITMALLSMTIAQDTTQAAAADSSQYISRMERPRIGGLKEFHNVLRSVWHTHIPNGDYKTIREMMPSFQENLKKVMDAEVPDFYQHIKPQYDVARQNLATAVARMDSIARGGSDSLLALAVEETHSAFEQAARVLAPRMKEIEKFHLVLYPLWHQALPKEDYHAIKAAMPELKAKMDTLITADIPESYQHIKEKIGEKREALKVSVDNLVAVCSSGKDEDIKTKLTEMHRHFMALDGVFE
jgi:hypothetical protein